MRQVIIGINSNGEPYVVAAPKKIEVIIRPDKAPTMKKRIRKMVYRVKCMFKR